METFNGYTDAQGADGPKETCEGSGFYTHTHGITLGKHVEWEGGQRETSEEHQHLRDEKRKQSSLQREVRMQAEESRKAGRVCLHGHQEKWHLRDL